jgi:hypothetical protein
MCGVDDYKDPVVETWEVNRNVNVCDDGEVNVPGPCVYGLRIEVRGGEPGVEEGGQNPVRRRGVVVFGGVVVEVVCAGPVGEPFVKGGVREESVGVQVG